MKVDRAWVRGGGDILVVFWHGSNVNKHSWWASDAALHQRFAVQQTRIGCGFLTSCMFRAVLHSRGCFILYPVELASFAEAARSRVACRWSLDVVMPVRSAEKDISALDAPRPFS